MNKTRNNLIANNIANQLKYQTMLNPGLFTGQSGVLLVDLVENMDNISSFDPKRVDSLLHMCNKLPLNNSLASGYTGILYYLHLLKETDILDKNSLSFISDIEEHIIKDIFYKKDNYDYLYGYLGFGFYLLRKYRNSHELINDIINVLEEIAIYTDKGIYWKDEYQEVNFGLSHGITAIIIFLSKCNNLNIQQNICKKLVYGFWEYILSRPKLTKLSFFPDNIVIPKEDTRIAWCHGDISIITALIHTSISFQDMTFLNKAKFIFTNCIERGINDSGIFQNNHHFDSCLCHGISGNHFMFDRIDSILNLGYNQNPFWLELLINQNQNYLTVDYNETNGTTEYVEEYDFLNGLTGISLVLSAHNQNRFAKSILDDLLLTNF